MHLYESVECRTIIKDRSQLLIDLSAILKFAILYLQLLRSIHAKIKTTRYLLIT